MTNFKEYDQPVTKPKHEQFQPQNAVMMLRNWSKTE